MIQYFNIVTITRLVNSKVTVKQYPTGRIIERQLCVWTLSGTPLYFMIDAYISFKFKNEVSRNQYLKVVSFLKNENKIK